MSDFTPLPAPKVQDMFRTVDIDPAVAEHFPYAAKLMSARPHGVSFWTRTARIELMLPGGTQQTLFLKVATGPTGFGMLRGEYFGVKELYRVVPDHVPRPVGYGTYRTDPQTHFYLCEFINMIEDLPDVRKFCAMLARLHRESMMLNDAPNQFGFHEVTYEGSMYQDVTWCNTWEEAFKLHFQAFIDQEKVSQGPSEQLDELLPSLFSKVIPRLLRPLQSHGRVLKPVLIHGDVWYGNIATNADTGEPIMFDPSVYWSHNEYDLDNMNVPRYRLGRHWMREYHKHFPISAPEEDCEDRNLLYAIRGHLCASTLYTDNNSFRKLAIDEIRKLVEKYPDGYQGE